jgi:hypothetical protein
MKTMKSFLYGAILLIVTVIGGSSLTSCSNDSDNPVVPEITLEDALKDGTIVVLTFNVNGEDFYVAFVRVGDTYELLDYDKALTRAAEPTITEKDCDFSMEHDKANNVIKFTAKEKKTSDLVMTANIDIKESTMEVIPGDPKYKVTGVKMKVSNVDITNLLKYKSEGVTLADALVKGAKVEISYTWYDNPPTIFTFTNDGGTFSCNITGTDAENFTGSLKINGSTLAFSAENWTDSDIKLELHFNTATNTFKYWTVTYGAYKSHTISVNGTDITSKLTKENV